MEKLISVIGIGLAGGTIAKQIFDSDPLHVNAIYINTAEKDLNLLKSKDTLSFLIGSNGGSGGVRGTAKKALKDDIKYILKDETFTDMLGSTKYNFIISSTAGGTGSGIAPMIYTALNGGIQKYDGKFILVGVLPRINEMNNRLNNTLSYLEELYQRSGDNVIYMLYDNNNGENPDPNKSILEINNAIVEDINNIFLRKAIYEADHHNMDDEDLWVSIVPGRLNIFTIKGINEKQIELKDIEDRLIQAEKRSMHVEIDRDNIIHSIAVMSYLDPDSNKYLNLDLPKIRSYLGEPACAYYNIATNKTDDTNNTITILCTGISPIKDRIQKIQKELDERLSRVKSQDKIVFDVEKIKLNDEKIRKLEDESPDLSLDDLFNKFQ